MPGLPEPLSEQRAAQLRTLIATLHFRFAKTLAFVPHEYVIRTADNGPSYAALLGGLPLPRRRLALLADPINRARIDPRQ